MGKLPSIWIRVTFRIPVEIYKQFKAVCAKNHTTMSSVVREFMIAIIADEKRFDVTYGALEEEKVPAPLQSTEVSENL